MTFPSDPSTRGAKSLKFDWIMRSVWLKIASYDTRCGWLFWSCSAYQQPGFQNCESLIETKLKNELKNERRTQGEAGLGCERCLSTVTTSVCVECVCVCVWCRGFTRAVPLPCTLGYFQAARAASRPRTGTSSIGPLLLPQCMWEREKTQPD